MWYLRGMLGLGDNIYQRAVIKLLGEACLVTSWPQIYADLPVRCIRPVTRLRTQAKNAARGDLPWATIRGPHQSRWNRIGYAGANETMLAGMLRSIGQNRARVIDFSGPPVNPIRDDKYIVVRPGSIRSEWRADARNPKPEYLQEATLLLKDDYRIISIADFQGGHEWPVTPLPFAHEFYHKGEMKCEQLLSLIAHASGAIGGVGWLLPMAMAYKTPMLLVYGGWGHINGPEFIFDDRIDSSSIMEAFPDNFCKCNDRMHNCDKTINNFAGYVEQFASEIAV